MDKTILLVDDEELFRTRLAKAFTQRGFMVFMAGDFVEALRIIGEQRPALGVFDLKMPGKSGLELIVAARESNPAMQIVVLTGYGSIATATEAVRLGALNYLPKPADVDDIIGAFARNPELALTVDQDEFSAPSLARAEWEHINRVLADCQGNISLAAKKLDLHRRTLQRKLQKYPPGK
ncbi:MAG: two-component system response regulator [Deltaproteobacteria bacterium RIFOXYD12_FULL_55_16]|nr:MAG: two-component system response regulator [Deltaproteobacteria bacterium RIFOXYD12_FULL_55_16]